MNAAELIRVMEQEAQPLVESLVGELRANLGTSHYRRLNEAAVFQRVHAVYQALALWLSSRDDAVLRSVGEELGKRRFEESTPLGQVVLALILTEGHLWKYLGSRAAQPEEEIRSVVTEFFQKMVYSAARGYEVALAISNRLAQRAGEVSKAPEPAAGKAPGQPAVPEGEGEATISRGGQVGEFGG